MSWILTMPEALYRELHAHLFPGDGDEHGAVIAAGFARGEPNRLLARNLFVARDGIDHVPGERGYRMLTPAFVREQILFCRDEQLAYLAVHCHGGTTSVCFSPDDMASHERGYGALRDVSRGQIVGALVLAKDAIAGDLWLPDGNRSPLARAVVVGGRRRDLFPKRPDRPAKRGAAYDRQARLFGDRGQALLSQLKIAVIGAGGGGSLINEQLARLGVGTIVTIDSDRFDLTNHPRVVGSRRSDASSGWLRRTARPKVKIAQRVAKEANPDGSFVPITKNIVDPRVAEGLADCDYLFLAADTAQARLVFNALVHQYLIPGVQIGAKIPVDRATGEVGEPFTVVRPVTPGFGCLWCNGLISSAALQQEALTSGERRAQRYVNEEDVPAPSVITMNAIGASHAVDEFLFNQLGLRKDGPIFWRRFLPRTGDVRFDEPRRDSSCSECSVAGRLGRGDALPLPVKLDRSLNAQSGSAARDVP